MISYSMSFIACARSFTFFLLRTFPCASSRGIFCPLAYPRIYLSPTTMLRARATANNDSIVIASGSLAIQLSAFMRHLHVCGIPQTWKRSKVVCLRELIPIGASVASLKCRQSCTSGKAGGLNCEPLKAVWPDYAGMLATRTSSVDRTVGLLSPALGYSCALALRPAPPLTRSIPSPKSSTPQNSSSDP